MNEGNAQEPGRHLILYDGVCGLCNRLVTFILPRDPRGIFHFSALQSDTSRTLLALNGRNPDLLENMYVVADYKSTSPILLARARAALFVLARLDSPWRHLRILQALPTFLLDAVYSLIARYRYRIFGKLEQCPVPTVDYARRFLDP